MIAGRHPPDPSWFTGGWEGIATDLELDALDVTDAMRLLAAYGLSDARAPAAAPAG